MPSEYVSNYQQGVLARWHSKGKNKGNARYGFGDLPPGYRFSGWRLTLPEQPPPSLYPGHHQMYEVYKEQIELHGDNAIPHLGVDVSMFFILRKNSINTISELEEYIRSGEQLTKLKQLGPVAEQEILKALEELSKRKAAEKPRFSLDEIDECV